MAQKKLWLLVFASAACPLFVSNAAATECVSEYTWKCADKPGNTCKGYFNGVPGYQGESFQESNPDSQCPSQFPPAHELWQVLRFSNLPKGAHKVRTSFSSQDVCGDDGAEVVNLKRRQANGCQETGAFQQVQALDPNCCFAEADYDLNLSGTTDICIGFQSTQSRVQRDEFVTAHTVVPGHLHPALVTTLDTIYTADREVTSPGLIFSGNYTNTRTSDDVREVLKEGGTGHRLMHVYEIQKIPAASSYTLKVEGSRPNNSDGDDFQILYKWSSQPCVTTGLYQTTAITINSATESVYTTAINGSTGNLCIGVDDTAQGANDDTVSIDHVYVEITDPVCP